MNPLESKVYLYIYNNIYISKTIIYYSSYYPQVVFTVHFAIE